MRSRLKSHALAFISQANAFIGAKTPLDGNPTSIRSV